MARIIKFLSTVCLCLCVSTVLVEGIGLMYFWMSGKMQPDRLFRAIAAIQGVDLYAIQTELEKANKPLDVEQVAFREILEARVAKSLNLDRREAAIERALSELRQLQATLITDQKRYDNVKNSFERQLKELREKFVAEGILDVVKTLESLPSKQAKEQILKMLNDEPVETYPQAMNDVVAIIKAMSLDKKKKILSVFVSAEESEILREILRNIRLGEPEVTLTRDARSDLQGN